MDAVAVLSLPDGTDTAARVLDLFQAEPLAMIEVASAIAHGRGQWPVEAVTQVAHDQARRIETVSPVALHDAVEHAIMGRDVDAALEWLHVIGVLPILFPELAATVNLVQEGGRLHKD